MNQRLTPWILFAATALVYLLFPTRVYYWDGITFAQAIEDAQSLDASLVHPNHLLYNFAGYFFYKLLRTFGIELRALTALQILNSFLSAICASVLFAILKDTLRSLYLAVCLTLLFAFSATWWKFSTDANAYVPSVLFLLVSFYLVLPERRARPWLVALTFFLSMAFHQLAVLMFPVLALGVYLQAGAVSIKRGVMNALYFSILSAALILASYAYLFSLARGSFDIDQFARWLTYYSPDADTQFRVWSNLLYTLRGHVRLFFGGRFNLLNDLVNPAIVLLLACLVAAVLWLLFSFLRNLGARNRDVENRKFRLQPHEKSVLLLSLVWAIVYVVFLFFFLPQNTFYRLFYLPALILLLGLGLSSLKNKASSSWRLAVFAAAVCLANFLFLIYPFSHVEKYPPLAFALQMNHEWPAGTVIYYGAESSDVSLVRYFTPGTHWRALDNKIFAEDQPVWLETSAINAVDPHWLETHARRESLKELADSGFRIRFLRVEP
ncbi:MAG TPA: hypothetical protein VEV42_16350 [Pyrinomonadaceae bacterium]|nr:hypothetical protein [Pyrinomonadaceae bacterium]